MATPRTQLVDPVNPLHYHLLSRCVRRSWLCGVDPVTGRNYNHRKIWLEERMRFLARHFAVAIDAYAIMSNHFHLVVYYDPQESSRWSDEEVADRWMAVFPPRIDVNSPADHQAILTEYRELLLQTPSRMLHARETLGSLAMFMKYLKQPIALRANKEDGCKGHFFEGRYYSGALLDEDAVIAAMVYVDLNPLRAKITQSIENYRAASGHQRKKTAKNTPERLKKAVEPIVSGLSEDRPALATTLEQYLEILDSCRRDYRTPEVQDKKSRWFDRVASLKKRQRAFGSMAKLSAWRIDRGWSVRGSPLPAFSQ